MNIHRRISPVCPKYKQQNTYDIIPGVLNIPEFQLDEAYLAELLSTEMRIIIQSKSKLQTQIVLAFLS